MTLAATGALASTALAAVHAAANNSAIAVSSNPASVNESSFAMAESFPKYKIIPVPGGMVMPSIAKGSFAEQSVVSQADFEQPIEAGVVTDGFGVIGALLLLSTFTFVMNFVKRTKQIVNGELGGKEKDAAREPEFIPFVRRGEEVSIFNPVRIGGEELPGRAAKNPEVIDIVFGKKGIQ